MGRTMTGSMAGERGSSSSPRTERPKNFSECIAVYGEKILMAFYPGAGTGHSMKNGPE